MTAGHASERLLTGLREKLIKIGAARSGMTAVVSDETGDEGRGAPGMKQRHECRTREPSNPNDWLRTRLVAPEFHCDVPR